VRSHAHLERGRLGDRRGGGLTRRSPDADRARPPARATGASIHPGSDGEEGVMKFQAPKGTHDILPGESERWEWLEGRARDILSRYGYREVRTPMFEATDLFVRSVGESTDIVRKELYSFEDKGGRSLTLRPEGTAAIVRA